MSKIFFVDLLDGYYYQVDCDFDKIEDEIEKYHSPANGKHFVTTKKEAIKLLNENNWFECKGCNLFFTDISLDKKEHWCKSLEIEN